MLTIAELRERAGGLSELSDEMLARTMFETYGPLYGIESFEQFAPRVGYDPDYDLGRGLKMGGLSAGAGLAQVGGRIAGGLGADGAQRALYGLSDQMATRAQQLGRTHDRLENIDSLGSAIDFMQQGVGSALGSFAPTVAGAALGAAAGGPLGIGAVTGAVLGGAATNIGVETGSIDRDLREQGIDNFGRAALYGTGAGLVDTLGDVVAPARFLRGAGREATGGLLRRAGREGAIAAGVEAPTEVIQTGIERAGAFRPLTGEEAYWDYANAAAIGALGGGAIGGTLGALPRQQPGELPLPEIDRPGAETDLSGATQERDLFGLRTTTVADPLQFLQEQERRVYEEITGLRRELGALQSGMAMAEAAGDAERFYQLQGAAIEASTRLAELADTARVLDQRYGELQVQDARQRAIPFDLLNREPQGDLFAPQAPLVQPGLDLPADAPPVQGVDPAQVSLFDERGQPTYAGMANTVAPDAEVAAHMSRTFSIPSTPKREPLLAAIGRAYLDGHIDDDEANHLVENLRLNKYGRVEKMVEELNARVAELAPLDPQRLVTDAPDAVFPGTETDPGAAVAAVAANEPIVNPAPPEVNAAFAGEPAVAPTAPAPTVTVRRKRTTEPAEAPTATATVEETAQPAVPVDNSEPATRTTPAAATPTAPLEPSATRSTPTPEEAAARSTPSAQARSPRSVKKAQKVWDEEALDTDPKFAELDETLQSRWTDAVSDGYNSAEIQTDIVQKQRGINAAARVRDARGVAVRKDEKLTVPKRTNNTKATTLATRAQGVKPGSAAYFRTLLDVELAKRAEKVSPEAMQVLDAIQSAALPDDVQTVRREVDAALKRQAPTKGNANKGSNGVKSYLSALAAKVFSPSSKAASAVRRLTRAVLPTAHYRQFAKAMADAGFAFHEVGDEAIMDFGPQSHHFKPAGQEIEDALTAAVNSDVGGFVGMALFGQNIPVFDLVVRGWDGTPVGVLGNFNPTTGAIGIRVNDHQSMVYTVIHEATHAADHAAAQGSDTYASHNPNSPTRVTFGTRADGSSYADLGPVVAEAVLKFMGGPSIMQDILQYPLGALADVLDGRQTDPYKMESAADHARVELVARLMEFYAANPKLMRVHLPKGYAFAEKLANAKSIAEITEAFYGTTGNRPTTQPGTSGVTGRPDRASANEARGSARDSRVGIARGLRSGAEGGTGSGRAAAGPATDAGVGGFGGLNNEATLAGDGSLAIPETLPARNIRERVLDLLTDVKASGKGLAALTLRQIGDVYKNHPRVKQFVDLTGKMVSRARQLQGEAFYIDTKWRTLDDKVSLDLQRAMLEATLAGAHPDVDFDDPANKHLHSENPKTLEKNRDAHARAKRLYDAAVAADPRAAEVYKEARDKLRNDWNLRIAAYKSAVLDTYAPILGRERAEQLAKVTRKADRAALLKETPSARRRAMRDLWEDVDEADEHDRKLVGPYFPLIRFGRHVVVLKSRRYEAVVAELQDAKKALQEALAAPEDAEPTTEQAEAIDEARKYVSEMTQALESAKARDEDYRVEFWEKKSQANARQQQIMAEIARTGRSDLRVEVKMREDYSRQLDSASPAFVKRLGETLKANLPTKDATAVENAVRDLIITSMPERSAMKAELHRLGVKGAQPRETRRAFAAAAIRNAWSISRLENGGQLNEVLMQLRTSDVDAEKIAGDELARRYIKSMEYDTSNELVNKISQASYVTYLGLSPSFLLMNIAQPWVVSAPVLAARKGVGVGRAASQLGSATSEVMRAMRASYKKELQETGSRRAALRFELDMQQFKNEDEHSMLRSLFDQGIIDITFEHDTGAVASGKAEGMWDKSVELISLPAHHTEVVNRVATALAAYRIARGLGESHAQASQYAERLVHETHMDYTAENAPRLFQSFGAGGRLVFQFKKYSQGMMYLVLKNAYEATKGDKEAAKTLGYMVGMQFAIAGTVGLPGAWVVGGLAAAVASLWEDDEEPDFKQSFLMALRDVFGETVGTAIAKGLPAAVGMDVSNRIGLGDLGNPLAFNRDNKSGDEWMAFTVMSLLGPAVSMGANWANGIATAKTDPIRATSYMLPKVLSDGLRAYDESTRGLRTQSGNVLVGPDALGSAYEVIRSLGFQPTQRTRLFEDRAALERAKQNRDEARSRLIRKFAETKMEGGDVAAIREKIDGFNQRHPDVRITYSSLRKAEVSRRNYQKDLVNGVRVQKRDAGLADRLGIR